MDVTKTKLHRIVRIQLVLIRRFITADSFPCCRTRWQGAEIRKVITQAPATKSNFNQTQLPDEKKHPEADSINWQIITGSTKKPIVVQ